MPLPEHAIKPTNISLVTVSHHIDNELEFVSNQTFCNLMYQMSSVLNAAVDIFEELSSKLSSLSTRFDTVHQRISSMHVSLKHIPPSDECLSVGLQNLSVKPFSSFRQEDSQVLNGNTKPTCMRLCYEQAESLPPLHIMDALRDDGKTTTRLYSDPSFFFDLWSKEMLAECSSKRTPRRKRPKAKTKNLPEKCQDFLKPSNYCVDAEATPNLSDTFNYTNDRYRMKSTEIYIAANIDGQPYKNNMLPPPQHVNSSPMTADMGKSSLPPPPPPPSENNFTSNLRSSRPYQLSGEGTHQSDHPPGVDVRLLGETFERQHPSQFDHSNLAEGNFDQFSYNQSIPLDGGLFLHSNDTPPPPLFMTDLQSVNGSHAIPELPTLSHSPQCEYDYLPPPPGSDCDILDNVSLDHPPDDVFSSIVAGSPAQPACIPPPPPPPLPTIATKPQALSINSSAEARKTQPAKTPLHPQPNDWLADIRAGIQLRKVAERGQADLNNGDDNLPKASGVNRPCDVSAILEVVRKRRQCMENTSEDDDDKTSDSCGWDD